MDLALQLLFTGIGIGAVYALVALGFVLIFRATNVVNFAQGEFSMVGAYLMVVFAIDLHWPYAWAFLGALAGMAVLGVVFNLGVYYPLRHRTFLPVIIATIGASIFLANTVLALYGPQPQVLSPWFETQGLQIGPVYLDTQYLLILALKAFAATIIGGFGDVKGAIIGGLALGVIETFGAAYISVPYKDGFAFLVLVAFLIFRPQGIFGERVAEKA